jgi:assimilatory nitrate reductase catalytic subunit
MLLTGRGTAAQWHTQTRTAKSEVLRKLYPHELQVEVHPSDARRLGLAAGAWVVVESRRGRVEARAFVTPTVPTGHVFLPMHDPAVNLLTFPAFDPYSRQPAYKACAVRLRPRERDRRDVASKPAGIRGRIGRLVSLVLPHSE